MTEPDPNNAVGKLNNSPMNRSAEKPLLFEPIKALRHFKGFGNSLLSPMHGNIRFRDGDNVAWCMYRSATADKCLHLGCQCGFYSVWNPNHEYANTGTVAVVELYGKVILGSTGARASNLKIVAVHLPPPSGRLPKAPHPMMDAYPSVRFYRSRDNMLAKEVVKRPDHLIYDYKLELGAGYGN